MAPKAKPKVISIDSNLLTSFIDNLDTNAFANNLNNATFKISSIKANRQKPPKVDLQANLVANECSSENSIELSLSATVDHKKKSVIVTCTATDCTNTVICQHSYDFIKWLIKTITVKIPVPSSAKKRQSKRSTREKLTRIMNETGDELEIEMELYQKYFSTKPIQVPTTVNLKLNVTPIDAIASAELTMKKLMGSFTGSQVHEFLTHCSQKMVYGLCDAAQVLTVEQADTALWHELRIGRITASRIHQASRCKTMSGSLYDSIMGKQGGFSFAMERGINLEDRVFDVVKNEFAGLEKSGLLLNSQYPHLGASPDGIHEDFVLEIKCPYNQITHAKYVDVKKLEKKYMAQIQLQMHLAGKTKALLAVADTNFGRNKRITKVWINFDEEYTATLMEDAFDYWMAAVYPGLKNNYN